MYSGEIRGSDGGVYEGYRYAILSCEIRRPIVWYISTDISEEPAASFIGIEEQRQKTAVLV